MQTKFTQNPSYLLILFGAVPHQLGRLFFYLFELCGLLLCIFCTPRGISISRQGEDVLIHMYVRVFGRIMFLDTASFRGESLRQLADALTQIADHQDGHFSRNPKQ